MIGSLIGIVLLIAFAGLQLVDAYTTYRALRDNTADEANPIAAWFFKHIGLVPSILGLKVIFLAIAVGLVAAGDPISIGVLGILTIIGGVVAINNIRVTTST